MRCDGKTVFITGASAGIGAACAKQFASAGARLLLCARRDDKLSALANELRQQFAVEINTVQLDVSDRVAVDQVLSSLPSEWQQIDVLVNNAGLAKGLEKIHEGVIDEWEQMIDINIKGLLYVTKHVLAGMVERQQGQIINIGSISGYQVYSGGVVYCATKFAVRALTEGLKMDVHGTPIRVSEVNPGMVETEFSAVRFSGDAKRAESVYADVVPLQAADVADAVLYCATRPAHVNIREIKVYPTAQTAAHLLHRESSHGVY